MTTVTPGTLLVDWDNTLHDAAGTFFAALRQVLAERGIRLDVPMYRAAYDPDYRVLYARLGLPDDEIDAASAAWRHLVRGAMPRLIPGSREALERIRDAAVPIYVVTAAPRAQVEAQLAATGVPWLTAIVAGGEAEAPRPAAAPLRLALERLDGGTSPIVYAGDTPADMRMAQAAGVRGIGVAGFSTTEAQLHAAGAAETAPSFSAWAGRWLGGSAERRVVG
jgi:phosphoglycolate phosphatase-like HAD superfamily hydrolase